MNKYTIGEIFRLGLLKNSTGEPYTAKATVSNVLKGVPFTTKDTPFGPAKQYTEKQINDLNDRWN